MRVILGFSISLYFVATLAWPQIERAHDILQGVAQAIAAH